MTQERKGYELLLGNIAVLTVFYLLLDFVMREWNVTVDQAMFWGWGGASVLITPFFLAGKKSRKNLCEEWSRHKKLIIGLAFMTVLAGALIVSGIAMSGSGPAVLLENLQPIFASILGVAFLSEQFTKGELFSAIIMLAGVVLIGSLKGEVPLLAVVVITASSFLYALQSFLFKQFGTCAHVFSFSFLRGWIVALLVMVFVFITGRFQLLPLPALGILFFIYILGILVSRYFFFQAHKYLEVSKLNIFLLLQPIGVLAGTYLFFADPMPMKKILGAILILGGGYFFVKSRKKSTQL